MPIIVWQYIIFGYNAHEIEQAKEIAHKEGITLLLIKTNRVFDPRIIKYDELLKHFWHIHDPCSLDKQGPDIGTQYASVLCVLNQIQKEVAEKNKKKSQIKFKKKIVTKICACDCFYLAEEYHQKYLKKNPGYMKICRIPEGI